jgi:uncharacterized protein (DUF2147 family)
MMHKRTLAMTLAIVIAMAAGLSEAAPGHRNTSQFPLGVWENEKHTVRVKIDRCGAAACGRVVWASAQAKADAKRGGTPNLIGVQLFQGLAENNPGVWSGKIFVPDLSGTFDGDVRPDGADHLKAQGCMAKLVCKSQLWTRLPR